MLRDKLNEALKDAMRARDMARARHHPADPGQAQGSRHRRPHRGQPRGRRRRPILSMLQGMIKQRNESIVLYEKGNRADLADKEKAEIAVIERFLPKQMDEAAVAGRRRRGHRRRRRQDGQGHGRRDGGAEGQVRRPDGLRQGLGRGEEDAGGIGRGPCSASAAFSALPARPQVRSRLPIALPRSTLCEALPCSGSWRSTSPPYSGSRFSSNSCRRR